MLAATNVNVGLRVDTIDDVSPHPKTRKNPQGAGRSARADKASSSIVGLRLTDDERARFQAAADAAGESLSEWIRIACENRWGTATAAKKGRRP